MGNLIRLSHRVVEDWSAICAFVARREVVVGSVLIAGKVNYPETIGQLVRQENSAYISAAYDCVKALESLSPTERRRIMSLYGFRDLRVPARNSVIVGTHNKRVLAVGHFWTIASQLILGAPKVISFLKRQTVL